MLAPMTPRLQTLLTEAQSLPDDEQDALADVVEDFLAGHADDATFTPEELAHIDRISAEPFVEADPREVEALFGRRFD